MHHSFYSLLRLITCKVLVNGQLHIESGRHSTKTDLGTQGALQQGAAS